LFWSCLELTVQDLELTYMLRIRAMAEDDCEAVAELSGELGYPTKSEAIRVRLRAINPSDLLVVAVTEMDRPVGFIQASRVCTVEADMRVHIVGLVVSSTVRRSGVGAALIAEVERWAQSIAAETVVVRSNTKRGEAHSFYPAVGYEFIKAQAVYQKRLR